MLTIHLVLLILALVCFLGSALKFEPSRVSLTPLGLFLWVLAILIGGR